MTQVPDYYRPYPDGYSFDESEPDFYQELQWEQDYYDDLEESNGSKNG